MSNLTLGSLFDGSGGFPLGGLLAGIIPVWASEIEPFPIMVTKKKLPFMKHYGDISQMNGREIEPVDIITFGSPCQDLSIAGGRAGIQDGERSSLFFQAIRIVKEMRCATNGKYPRYIVWENVPGAFSSNGGEDFRCVLESICRVKNEQLSVPRPAKWANAGEILGEDFSIAWRQFDAQYWGVPQRRKRIYLVADFDGRSAGKILFESEGLSGYTPQGFRSWEGIAGDSAESTGETSGNEDDGVAIIDSIGGHSESYEVSNIAGTLKATHYKNPPSIANRFLFENHSQDTRYTGPHVTAQTVSSTFGMGGNNQPFVVEEPTPKTLKIRSGCEKGGGKGALIQNNKSATLSCNNDQTLFEPCEADNTNSPIVYGICSKDSNAMKSSNPNSGFYEAKTTRTIDVNGGNPSCNQGGMAVVALEGNGSRPSHHGDGYSEADKMYTLNTIEQHGVAYGIGRDAFNQGKNAKFNPAVVKEIQPTMVAKGPGGVAEPIFPARNAEKSESASSDVVTFDDKAASLSAMDGPKGPSSQMLSNPESNFVAEHIYSTSKNSYHTQALEDKANTLVASDYKDPPLINDRPVIGFYPQMKAEGMAVTEEKSTTLVNGTNPGYQNGVVDPEYIVRRLMPTECARLQGFPDWWCSDLGTEHPTSEEVYEWYKIFETHRKITGSSLKSKTEKQIRAFLQEPHSDSAEYKMWGNGVALPCVYFVLSGISWVAEMENSGRNL